MSIKIFNIEKKEFEYENVCAEGFMRFLYGNGFGKLAVWTIFRRAFFSRLCGLWADSKISAGKIEKFIEANSISRKDMLKDSKCFATFNEFFTRALALDARKLADCDISFPSDGRHLLIRNITKCDSFYIKGQSFNLEKFLNDPKLAARFDGADMLISRLSPVDYHRFHYPVSGEIVARKLINGALFSVSPIALIPRISIFWENKRVLNIIDSKDLGMCAFVEIGATNVGGIVNFDNAGSFAARGAEAGYFRLGGSCVVTLIPKSAKIAWDEKLVEMSAQNIECYCKVNSFAGRRA